MYSYVSAHLIPKGSAVQPVSVNISSMLLHTIFLNYQGGYITLSNPALGGLVYVELGELQQSTLPLRNLAFTTWLGSLGALTIPSTTDEPNYDLPKVVRYRDAYASGFAVNKIHPTYSGTVQVDNHELSDAIMTGEFLNVPYAQDYLLTTVNGFLHYSYPRENGIVIEGASRTLETGDNNSVGLLNFIDVGEIKQYRLSPTTVLNENDLPLHISAIIQLGVPLTGKTVLCSIGGVLHGEHDIVSVLDRENGVIKIRTNKLDLLYRYMTTRRMIDLSGLDLNLPEPIENASLTQAFKTDAAVMNYLTSTHSFAIVVDNPTMAVSRTLPLYSQLLGEYTSTLTDALPLIGNNGRLIPYRRTRQGAFFSLQIDKDEYRVPAYVTTNPADLGTVADVSHHSQREALKPYFLRISAK